MSRLPYTVRASPLHCRAVKEDHCLSGCCAADMHVSNCICPVLSEDSTG